MQNLILRGHESTKLTALRMTPEMDAGPVYLKRDLYLHGNAEAIYMRASQLAASMIHEIISTEPEPEPQEGEPVVFQRRSPEESEIPGHSSLDDLYDFVRMLDAEGYPRAYLVHNGFRYEFRRAAQYNGRIEADVVITPVEDEGA